MIDGRFHRVQRDIGAAHATFGDPEMMQGLAEGARMALPVVVGLDVNKAIHVTTTAGEHVEAARRVFLGEMNEDVVVVLSLDVILQEEGVHLDVVVVLSLDVILQEEGVHLGRTCHLLADHAVGTIGSYQITARELHARLQGDEDAAIGLFLETGKTAFDKLTTTILVILQQVIVEVRTTRHTNLVL